MKETSEETEKLYYSITEVSAMFDVNASALRFWEKEFDILQPAKNKKGNRLFTKKDIEHIAQIVDLVKHKGFTIQGAREQLKTRAFNKNISATSSDTWRCHFTKYKGSGLEKRRQTC